MPTWQFDTQLTSDGSVLIPPEVAAQLQPQDSVRVIISTDDGESQWEQLTTEQFLQGYGPGDDIYDQLPNR